MRFLSEITNGFGHSYLQLPGSTVIKIINRGLESKDSKMREEETTMAAPYDIPTYLLDRANIQDILTRTVRSNQSTFSTRHQGY